jgi:hypothetical protein
MCDPFFLGQDSGSARRYVHSGKINSVFI